MVTTRDLKIGRLIPGDGLFCDNCIMVVALDSADKIFLKRKLKKMKARA